MQKLLAFVMVLSIVAVCLLCSNPSADVEKGFAGLVMLSEVEADQSRVKVNDDTTTTILVTDTLTRTDNVPDLRYNIAVTQATKKSIIANVTVQQNYSKDSDIPIGFKLNYEVTPACMIRLNFCYLETGETNYVEFKR